MPHIITYTEEIEEHGYCQQRPELKTGDKYLHEVAAGRRIASGKRNYLERIP